MEAENNKKLCKNCDYPMDSCYKFCTNCGQKDLNKKLSIKDFIVEFLANFYAFDSKVLTSLRYLLTKPGVMAREFVNGKRFKFVNPFRLLLSLAILLGLLMTLSTFLENLKSIKTLKYEKKDSIEKDSIIINFGNEKIIIGKKNDTTWINKKRNIFYTKKHIPKEKELTGIFDRLKLYTVILYYYPSLSYEEFCIKNNYKNNYWYKKFFEKLKLIHGDDQLKNSVLKNLIGFLISTLPYFLFLSLPFFTILLYLFFYKAGYNFTENLIFTFYLFSNYILPFIFIEIINCFFINSNFVSKILDFSIFFLVFYNWIYFYKSLKNFYSQKKSIIRIKFVILSFLMPLVLSLSITLIVFISFLMS